MVKSSEPIKKQRLIGVVLCKGTWTMYGFFKEALQGIQKVAFSKNYGLVILTPAPGSRESLKELLASHKKYVSGTLLVAPEGETSEFEDLSHGDFPMIILYRHVPNLSYVGVDNEGGALALVEHLIQLGHNRIAFINGNEEAMDSQQRFLGYKEALKRNNLPFKKDYVLAADSEQANSYRATKDLLSHADPPTAIFAANDYMALGAMSAIQDEGLSVPGDVAVVGFDDLDVPSLTFRAPSLSTVRQPIYDIAKDGTESLIAHIEGREKGLHQKIFPSQLIIRTSCGASRQSQHPPTDK